MSSYDSLDPELTDIFSLLDPVPQISVEHRLYYDHRGRLLGLWSSDHPQGSYIVIEDVSLFLTRNTADLRVINGTLTTIAETRLRSRRLIKQDHGTAVALGHVALVLDENDTDITREYYEIRHQD